MQIKRLSHSDSLDLWFLRLELEATRNNIVSMIDTGHILFSEKGIVKFLEIFEVLVSKFDKFYSSVKEQSTDMFELTGSVIDYEINFITHEFKAKEVEKVFELREEALIFMGFAGDYVSIVDQILAGENVL